MLQSRFVQAIAKTEYARPPTGEDLGDTSAPETPPPYEWHERILMTVYVVQYLFVVANFARVEARAQVCAPGGRCVFSSIERHLGAGRYMKLTGTKTYCVRQGAHWMDIGFQGMSNSPPSLAQTYCRWLHSTRHEKVELLNTRPGRRVVSNFLYHV